MKRIAYFSVFCGLMLTMIGCGHDEMAYKEKLKVKTGPDPELTFVRYEDVLFNLDTARFQQELIGIQDDFKPFLDGDLTNPLAIKYLKDFCMTHTRIDDRCKDSPVTKMLYLILHQGNKRSNDKTHTFHCKSRNLKRNTLTATRRHQSKSIMTGTYALNNLFLDSPKRGETEILPKDRKVVHN